MWDMKDGKTVALVRKGCDRAASPPRPRGDGRPHAGVEEWGATRSVVVCGSVSTWDRGWSVRPRG
ncbi:hypothetical protein GCM10010425_65700 [Streptomyces spororaveus]